VRKRVKTDMRAGREALLQFSVISAAVVRPQPSNRRPAL
jgi:hypothetical protein